MDATDLELNWPEVKRIWKCETKRVIGKRIERHTMYGITSTCVCDCRADELARRIKEHWSVENPCHWILDCTVGEDKSRIRKGNGPVNMGIMRRLVLTILHQQ